MRIVRSLDLVLEGKFKHVEHVVEGSITLRTR